MSSVVRKPLTWRTSTRVSYDATSVTRPSGEKQEILVREPNKPVLYSQRNEAAAVDP